MNLAHDAHNVIAAMNIPIEWRLVLFAICQRGRLEFAAGLAELGARAGCDQLTASRAVRHFVAAGILEVTRERRGSEPRAYRLRVDRLMGDT